MDWRADRESDLNDKIRQKLLDMRSFDNKINAKLREVEIQKSRLSSELCALKKTKKVLESENNDLNTKIEKLTKQNNVLMEKLKKKDEDIEAHKDALTIQKTKIAFLQKNKANLEKRIDDLTEQMLAKKEDNVNAQSQISHLERSLIDMKHQLKNKADPKESTECFLRQKLKQDMLFTRLKRHEQVIENLNNKVKDLKEENQRLSNSSENDFNKEFVDTQTNKILFKIIKKGVKECSTDELKRISWLIASARNKYGLGEDSTIPNLPTSNMGPENFQNNEIPRKNVGDENAIKMYPMTKMSSLEYGKGYVHEEEHPMHKKTSVSFNRSYAEENRSPDWTEGERQVYPLKEWSNPIPIIQERNGKRDYEVLFSNVTVQSSPLPQINEAPIMCDARNAEFERDCSKPSCHRRRSVSKDHRRRSSLTRTKIRTMNTSAIRSNLSKKHNKWKRTY